MTLHTSNETMEGKSVTGSRSRDLGSNLFIYLFIYFFIYLLIFIYLKMCK